MKKTLAFFTLLLGCVAMFAQSGPTFPYQAVVRNSQNQLIKDSTFAIGVEVYQGADLKFSETQSVTTNANGQLTMNIGGGAEVSGAMNDVTDWSVAKFKLTYHLSEGDIVSENAVNPVPYALQAASATGGNFLTSDSAVITTMQGNITTNTTNIATNTDNIAALANRVNTFNTNVCDSVKDCDFSDNASIQNMLQELSDLISAQNHKIDSLGHIVDSLSNLPHGNTPAATFTCGTDSVKDADNNWYHTVKIGSQCWMKENLRTKKTPDGTSISKVWTPRSDSVTSYGRLYYWSAVMNGAPSSNATPSGVQGICPDGWHVPSDNEWKQMEMAAGMSQSDADNTGLRGNIAAKLCGNTGWNSSNNDNAPGKLNASDRNSTGFSALPAGNYYGGGCQQFGTYAYFWSATTNSSNEVYCCYLNYDNAGVGRNNHDGYIGYSVRCLRNPEAGGGTTPSAPATMSCEQVMECMGDTLGKLNTKIEAQGETITTQGHTIDSLGHIVDSLSNLIPGGGDTPTEVADGQPCPGAPTVTDVDNNVYNTVKIGSQCWMKENMKTTRYADSTDIETNTMCNPGNSEDYVATYGKLYTWSAATRGSSTTYPAAGQVKVQGICPTGWHVPSDAEWYTLTYYVFNSTSPNYKCGDECGTCQAQSDVNCIANALSSTTGWSNNTSDGCNAGNSSTTLNATGFSAVPAGRYLYGSPYDFGGKAHFWSATQDGGDNAWYRCLYSNYSFVGSRTDNKDNGCSVRCLRD